MNANNSTKEELFLDNQKITSIQQIINGPIHLKSFTSLKHLSLSNCGLLSLEHLPSFQFLLKLDLMDNKVTTTAPLAKIDLPNLTHLDLSNNRISHLDALLALKSLPSLQHLNLIECQICKDEKHRQGVFDLLPNLISLNSKDREGNDVDYSDSDEDDVEEDYDEEEEDDHLSEEGEEEEEETETLDEEEDSKSKPTPSKTIGGKQKASHHHQPIAYQEDEEDVSEGEEEEDEEIEEIQQQQEGLFDVVSRKRNHASSEEEEDDELLEDEDETPVYKKR